jgi:hypothetical protein
MFTIPPKFKQRHFPKKLMNPNKNQAEENVFEKVFVPVDEPESGVVVAADDLSLDI